MMLFLGILALVVTACMAALIVISAANSYEPGAKPDLTHCAWPALIGVVCLILYFSNLGPDW